MKPQNPSQKNLFVLCLLICFTAACNQSELPSIPGPPVQPDWLLAKAHFHEAGNDWEDTIHYNSFYEPCLRKVTHSSFGDPIDQQVDTFIYNSKRQLVKAQRLLGRPAISVLLDYNPQGKLAGIKRFEQGAGTREVRYSHRGSIVESVILLPSAKGIIDTIRITFFYNSEGNIHKTVRINPAGDTLTTDFKNYDQHPNFQRMTNLDISVLFTGRGDITTEYQTEIEPVLSVNNVLLGDSTFYYEWEYNAQGLPSALNSSFGYLEIDYIQP